LHAIYPRAVAERRLALSADARNLLQKLPPGDPKSRATTSPLAAMATAASKAWA